MKKVWFLCVWVRETQRNRGGRQACVTARQCLSLLEAINKRHCLLPSNPPQDNACHHEQLPSWLNAHGWVHSITRALIDYGGHSFNFRGAPMHPVIYWLACDTHIGRGMTLGEFASYCTCTVNMIVPSFTFISSFILYHLLLWFLVSEPKQY